MWTNDQTAALIAAIEEDTLKACQFNDNAVSHLNYGPIMDKCVFDLPRDWITIARKLNRLGKPNVHRFLQNKPKRAETHTR